MYHESIVQFLALNSPCPMRNFECSTCGGDKSYIERLDRSIDKSSLKLALLDLGGFSQVQINLLCDATGITKPPLALMMALFATDELEAIFDAWVSSRYQTEPMLILITEGHIKRWRGSKEALLKLLKINRVNILGDSYLKTKVCQLNDDFDLGVDITKELHNH
jgi:hypothetical protein